MSTLVDYSSFSNDFLSTKNRTPTLPLSHTPILHSSMFFTDLQHLAGPPEVSGEKWLKYYCSNHDILLVGDGDFSFSLSLATSFGSASNIVATSLDSYRKVVRKYKNARFNLSFLKGYGASVLHGVDATKMKRHVDLHMRKFDRIIFNFPHAGFFGREDTLRMIQRHKKLVSEFFKNASQMLRVDGEIHVNHKTKAPFCDWNIIHLAHQNSLELIGCANFNIQDYPGYNNKRGQGNKCDDPFFLGECSTFKFSINHRANRAHELFHMVAIDMQRNLPFQEIPFSNYYHHPYPTSIEPSYPHSHITMQNQPTPFEPDYSRVTYSINARGYQAPPSVVSLNQTYLATSLDTAQAYANRHLLVEGSLVNTVGDSLSTSVAGMPERTLNDSVHWSSNSRSYYGEGIDRSYAYTSPGLFGHW